MNIQHNISPIYNKNSKILILGSFPSVKSRDAQFFYHHPQNRFWVVLASILNQQTPKTIEDKTKFLLENRIAVWDVIKSCDIINSSDSSIKNVRVNDFNIIFNTAKIDTIFINGNKAFTLYEKYCKNIYDKKVILMPSTSPANAKYRLNDLIEKWSEIKDYLFS